MLDEQHVIENVLTMRRSGMTWEQVVKFINDKGPAWWARTGRQDLAAAALRFTGAHYIG